MGKRNSLQWYGHVLRKVDDDWENKMCYFGGQGSQTEMQAQKKKQKKVVHKDMNDLLLKPSDAVDRGK